MGVGALVGWRRRCIRVVILELHRGCLWRCSEGCVFLGQCTPLSTRSEYALDWSLPPPLACSMRACTLRRSGPSLEELARVNPSRALARLAAPALARLAALALARLAALALARSCSAHCARPLSLGSLRALALARLTALARFRSARCARFARFRSARCARCARTRSARSSLGRSLLPLWYLPALTKVHRPLLKILLSSQQLKKCRLKCFRGSTSLQG